MQRLSVSGTACLPQVGCLQPWGSGCRAEPETKIASCRAFHRKNSRRPQATNEFSGPGDTPSKGSSIPDKLPLAGSDTDWREFRARLVAGEAVEVGMPDDAKASTSGREEEQLWAHPITQPEKGCLLLAHPLMFSKQQRYFHQAVILIIDHSENGSAGLILNKPLEHLIGAEALMPEFNDNRLFLGGDVGGERGNDVMQLLHDQKDLENCVEVVNGVYLGGFQAAKKAVRREELDAVKHCRWYCRYAGWAPGQLQAECEKGVWFTAAASKDMILHPCTLVNGRQHWHRIMQKMGGEYSQLSEALLVEPQIFEEVWGNEEFLQSTQRGPLKPENEEDAV